MTDWNAINRFIAAVIAWPAQDEPGYANLQSSYYDARQSDGKVRGKYPISPGKPFRDVSQFCSYASWLNTTTNNKDVWFCTSLQAKTKTNKRGNVVAARSAQDALWQKSVWIDADAGPGKKYATQAIAWEAISKFARVAGLPRPSATVNSGGGLHVYWISKTPLSPLEWAAYASGLRNMLVANGVVDDPGLTTDIARILRMPGTFNHKTNPPKPVDLLPFPLKLYTFDTDLAVLKSFSAPVNVAPTGPAHNIFADGVDPAIFRVKPVLSHVEAGEPGLEAGIDKFTDVLVDARPLFRAQDKGGCEVYRDAFKTGGKDHTQPLWNLLVLGTTFMENGDAIAHAISKEHAEYSPLDTQALYDRKMAERHDRGIGYPSCAAIAATGCGACQTCPLFAKGKSPLNIRPPVTATVNPKMGQSAAATKVGLPSGFDFNDNGIICKVMEETTKDGEDLPAKLLPLFQTKLYDFWAQKHPDCLNYTVDTDKGFHHFACVPHEEMSKQGFRAYLASPRCRTLIDVRGSRFLEEFYLSTLGKLRAQLAAQEAVPFGWYEEGGKIRGFAYGGKIAMDDGTFKPCGIGDPEIKRNYTPVGSLDEWRKACAVITGRKRPELTSILLMSFASPLTKLIAKSSVLFSTWGDSAAGKSASYKVGMSVWGHSILTKGSERSTVNNITTTMSQIKHLPFYWDEIEDDKYRETVAKIMHEASDGAEKGRNTSGNTTQARGSWKLMMMCASNQSFKEFLYNRNKNHTASIVRCLEWKVLKIDTGPGMLTDAEASVILDGCESNYGRMGELYAAFLAQNHAAIQKEVVDEANKVEGFFGYNGEERFWSAGVASMICAARYAHKLGVDVDPEDIKNFMYDVYAENREAMVKRNRRGTLTDRTETILTLYLKARAANERMIWTNYMQTGPGKPPKPIVILKGPQQPRNAQGGVEARFSIDNQILVIATTDFDEWLQEKRYQSTPVYDALERAPYFARFVKQMQVGSGTIHNAGREPCMVLTVDPVSPLGEYMLTYATEDERKAVETGVQPAPLETGFDNAEAIPSDGQSAPDQSAGPDNLAE